MSDIGSPTGLATGVMALIIIAFAVLVVIVAGSAAFALGRDRRRVPLAIALGGLVMALYAVGLGFLSEDGSEAVRRAADSAALALPPIGLALGGVVSVILIRLWAPPPAA